MITPADSGGDVFNLVLGLRMERGEEKATASGVAVGYTIGRDTHTYRTTNSVELRRDPC